MNVVNHNIKNVIVIGSVGVNYKLIQRNLPSISFRFNKIIYEEIKVKGNNFSFVNLITISFIKYNTMYI